MYNSWKAKGVVPKGVGRPKKMKLSEVEDAVTISLEECKTASSTFQLQDMKDTYATKKKEEAVEADLNPDSINCGVSDRTAKVAMVATAMGSKKQKFADKKLLTKTEKQFQAKHSVQGAYAYALTVLSTH